MSRRAYIGAERGWGAEQVRFLLVVPARQTLQHHHNLQKKRDFVSQGAPTSLLLELGSKKWTKDPIARAFYATLWCGLIAKLLVRCARNRRVKLLEPQNAEQGRDNSCLFVDFRNPFVDSPSRVRQGWGRPHILLLAEDTFHGLPLSLVEHCLAPPSYFRGTN